MYVFDRGYVDYERFYRMTDEGYFFVSRLKKDDAIREVDSFSLPDDCTVLSDKMVYIGTTQNRTENVFRLSWIGYKWRPITSRAGHIATFMNNFCLTSMIFVPSINGCSHSPKELTD